MSTTKKPFWAVLLLTFALVSALAGCSQMATTSAADEPPAPFLDAWRACGGAEGAGAWLHGPVWFRGNLIGVTRYMVWIWSTAAPERGVRPLNLRAATPAVTPKDGYTYEHGHNVLPDFVAWIKHHGGWQCAGFPIGEPFSQDKKTSCQEFAAVTLCHDPKTHEVSPQPVGKTFWQEKHALLENGHLPIDQPPQKGWEEAITLSMPKQGILAIDVAVSAPPGVELSQATVAVEIQDASAHRTLRWIVARLNKEGHWKAEIALPRLSHGLHTLASSACVVWKEQWQACNASSLTIKP